MAEIDIRMKEQNKYCLLMIITVLKAHGHKPTQKQLADIMGVTRQTINRYKKELYQDMCEICGV